MKNLAMVLLGLFLGVGVSGFGQNKAGSERRPGTVRKVAPQDIPEAMRPHLPNASEIRIGNFLVIHGGPAKSQRICVFPDTKNHSPS